MIGKRLFIYASQAALAIGVIFLFWYMLGVAEMTEPRFVFRAGLIGWAVLFFLEAGTNIPLVSRLWSGPFLLLTLWLGMYSVITMKGAVGWLVTSETLNYSYFIGIGSAVFTAAMMYFARDHKRWRPLFLGAAGFLSVYLMGSIFCYLGYFLSFHALFGTTDMIPVFQSNAQESREFLASHLGWGLVACLLGLCLLAAALVMGLMVSSARQANVGRLAKWQRLMTGIAVLGSCILLIRYVPSEFPLHQYREAKRHLEAMARVAQIHASHMKDFKLVGNEEDRMPAVLPGTVILVIGESANRDHMKAFTPSYKEDTTPWLSSEKEKDGLYLFSNAYSNFPQTVPSLSMALTGWNQYNGKAAEDEFTIMDIARAAGYTTYWISNQGESEDGLLSMIAGSADNVWYVTPYGPCDEIVMGYLKKIPQGNNFIVIHLHGSHDRYKDRVSEDFKAKHPDTKGDKVKQYDLSLQYTDYVLEGIYTYGKARLEMQTMIYVSDHSEDMIYFHSGNKFTYDMVRIPFFIYLSPAYEARYPAIGETLRAHERSVFTNDLIYDMIGGVLHARPVDYDAAMDISSPAYAMTREKALAKHGLHKVADDPLGFS